ncbi:EAL domain-containing protein (putative c-di-GMP-specific phosphodiesterase class I)/PleD family two-component response regulator [Xanthomonas sacchari]|uniref:EAL domain-containing protein n=1 Tax=Xanthomonas sacchari TaxID=56458 RepID=UPI0027829D49|nr:EAL domain-containing response regulator [Xanthomonas sacchari]MDQ1090865.1 EAL domain-containing protein (putative c-di-GMP-specific phosphodiesterase class I)/PleD family two-component response regulator [Xanthomonas sacchari]
MPANDAAPLSHREDPRARHVRAETPPPHYWRRWVGDAERAVPAEVGSDDRAADPVPAESTAAATPLASTDHDDGPADASAAAFVVADAGSDPAAQAAAAPYRVLIVEDDRAQALFAQSVLHGAGMHALVQMQAEGVQQAIVDYRPDLILMDLHMPGLDGMRLTTLIRQQPQHQLLPIVFLSGDADPELEYEVLDSGADDFLTKPIRPRHLIAAVSNRIRRARQQAQQGHAEAVPLNNPETGLPTRAHLLQLLDTALRTRRPGSLYFIEIASALGLRERYGYAAFERLMAQAGRRLAGITASQPLARLNDNSFLLLAEDSDADAQRQRAQGLRDTLSGHAFPLREDEALHLRCAIGYADFGHGFEDAGSALEAVERTALQARLQPQGIAAYVPPRVEEDLQRIAMLEGQLEPAYQPIVAVAGGDIAQYQVLLRLRQRDGSLLSAGQVLPAAEAIGRIADLDQQVLDHALGLLHLYQHATPPLRLFVSQSSRTLARTAFAEWLIDTIGRRGVTGTSLVIDLRLDDALVHTATLQQFCARLMPLGVQFCISQFEPGAEAEALLAHLPLGYLRLSARFAGAHADPDLRDQLRATIDLAHRAGLLIIGQQIEQAQAAAAMWMGGVDFIQGNLVQSVGDQLNFDFQNAVL